MRKKYTILSNEPAPERVVEIFSISEIIQFSNGLSNDGLEEWFEEYRYDAEISQGEIFYKKSKSKSVEFPDNTTKNFEISVEGKEFEEQELDLAQQMKDFDILIRGEMEWTGGTWNTFSIELDESEKFDSKKIKAKGDCGLIVNYTYDGEEFTNNEDWSLSDGYINLDVSIFYDGSLHKIELDDLRNELEVKGIDTLLLDPDVVSNHLIEKINNVKDVAESGTELEVTQHQIEKALLLHPKNMRMAAKYLKLDYETFKEKIFEAKYEPCISLWIPELKKASEIQDSENVNKIKSIVEDFVANPTDYQLVSDFPDELRRNGFDVEPYNIMTATTKIKLKNGNFYIARKRYCNKKADFIVGKFTGWSDIE